MFLNTAKLHDVDTSLVTTDLPRMSSQVKSIHVINMFRRQGCPHLGQGHGPIIEKSYKIVHKEQSKDISKKSS